MATFYSFLQIWRIECLLAWRYLRGPADQSVFFHANVRLAIFFMGTMLAVIILVFSVFYGFQNSIYQTLWDSAPHIRIEHQFSRTFVPPHKMYQRLQDSKNLRTQNETEDLHLETVYSELSVPVLLTGFSNYEIRNLIGIPWEHLHANNYGSGDTDRADDSFSPSPPKDEPSRKSFVLPLTYFQENIVNDPNKMKTGNYVLIGSEMAQNYGYSLGDQIDLFLPKQAQFENLEDVIVQQFTIVGFFKTGYYEFDQGTIYMGLASLQRLLSLKNQVTSIVVRLKERQQLEIANRLISEKLAINDEFFRPIDSSGDAIDFDSVAPLQIRLPSFMSSTIEEERKNLFQALDLERTMLLIILSFLVGAGIIGIWVCIALLIKAKEYSLGVLRAMGMSDASIIRIFCLSSLGMGFASLMIGMVFGIFLTNRLEGLLAIFEHLVNSVCPFLLGQCRPISLLPENIYYVDSLPVAIDMPTLFFLGIGTLTLSLLAGYFPSRSLLRQSPIKILAST